ncbi:MAG TPA: type II CAAX endopeptidase family protein [Pseudogracilibacillus sp.]|nr:type II CAAX endopeptidase family protein [Pseudogracilibacillus sp.]
MIPKRYWFTLLTYVLMHASGLVTIPIFALVFKLGPVDALVYSQLFAFILATIISLFILRNDISNELKTSQTGVGKIITWSIIGLFLAYLAQLTAASIEMYVLGIDPGSENTADIMKVINASTIFLLIPAIFAPILEELVFRKIIFGSLYKRMNFFWAAILSSIAFGVIHLDLTHLLIYTGMGLVFSYLYVKTKTIIVPIIVHMGMNTITVLAQLFIDVEELERLQNELGALINLIGG